MNHITESRMPENKRSRSQLIRNLFKVHLISIHFERLRCNTLRSTQVKCNNRTIVPRNDKKHAYSRQQVESRSKSFSYPIFDQVLNLGRVR